VDVLGRAVAVLGPLEGRIMRCVWTSSVGDPFVVRDVQALMPELAYTTVMTTLRRLASKGLLRSRALPGQKAHEYTAAMTPERYLAVTSTREVAQVVERYGDAALAAFAAELVKLTPEQRQRLQELQE
jgi:predicted transcriptional regulator